MGIFYRTIRMIENGIKPVYVFDGKPPHMKSGEVRCHFLILLLNGIQSTGYSFLIRSSAL